MAVKRKTHKSALSLAEYGYIRRAERDSEIAKELRRLARLDGIKEIVWYGDAEPRPSWM